MKQEEASEEAPLSRLCEPLTVIPEAILIGNPESQGLKIWIPDKDTRG
jgi:hypothetical protein